MAGRRARPIEVRRADRGATDDVMAGMHCPAAQPVAARPGAVLPIVVLLCLLVAGCDGLGASGGPVYGDYRLEDPVEAAVLAEVGVSEGDLEEEPAEDDPVDPVRFSVVQVLVSAYDSTPVRTAVVERSLADVETTRGLLEGQGFDAEAVDRIIGTLEADGPDLAVDVFLHLPIVVDLRAELEDELVPLG